MGKGKITKMFLQEMKDEKPVGELFEVDLTKEPKERVYKFPEPKPYWEHFGYKTEEEFLIKHLTIIQL